MFIPPPQWGECICRFYKWYSSVTTKRRTKSVIENSFCVVDLKNNNTPSVSHQRLTMCSALVGHLPSRTIYQPRLSPISACSLGDTHSFVAVAPCRHSSGYVRRWKKVTAERTRARKHPEWHLEKRRPRATVNREIGREWTCVWEKELEQLRSKCVCVCVEYSSVVDVHQSRVWMANLKEKP